MATNAAERFESASSDEAQELGDWRGRIAERRCAARSRKRTAEIVERVEVRPKRHESREAPRLVPTGRGRSAQVSAARTW